MLVPDWTIKKDGSKWIILSRWLTNRWPAIDTLRSINPLSSYQSNKGTRARISPTGECGINVDSHTSVRCGSAAESETIIMKEEEMTRATLSGCRFASIGPTDWLYVLRNCLKERAGATPGSAMRADTCIKFKHRHNQFNRNSSHDIAGEVHGASGLNDGIGPLRILSPPRDLLKCWVKQGCG